MDPKSLISNIEMNRALIKAHAARLAETPPHPIKVPAHIHEISVNTAGVVDSVVSDQMTTAVGRLCALNDTEIDSAAKRQAEHSDSVRADIDLEASDYKEV